MTTVSYTHLDVYKRQLHIHVLQAASLRDLVIFHGGIVLVHAADVGPAVAGSADLDVYKRQAMA